MGITSRELIRHLSKTKAFSYRYKFSPFERRWKRRLNTIKPISVGFVRNDVNRNSLKRVKSEKKCEPETSSTNQSDPFEFCDSDKQDDKKQKGEWKSLEIIEKSEEGEDANKIFEKSKRFFCFDEDGKVIQFLVIAPQIKLLTSFVSRFCQKLLGEALEAEGIDDMQGTAITEMDTVTSIGVDDMNEAFVSLGIHSIFENWTCVKKRENYQLLLILSEIAKRIMNNSFEYIEKTIRASRKDDFLDDDVQTNRGIGFLFHPDELKSVKFSLLDYKNFHDLKTEWKQKSNVMKIVSEEFAKITAVFLQKEKEWDENKPDYTFFHEKYLQMRTDLEMVSSSSRRETIAKFEAHNKQLRQWDDFLDNWQIKISDRNKKTEQMHGILDDFRWKKLEYDQKLKIFTKIDKEWKEYLYNIFFPRCAERVLKRLFQEYQLHFSSLSRSSKDIFITSLLKNFYTTSKFLTLSHSPILIESVFLNKQVLFNIEKTLIEHKNHSDFIAGFKGDFPHGNKIIELISKFEELLRRAIVSMIDISFDSQRCVFENLKRELENVYRGVAELEFFN